jgi:hypothetical protein
MRNSISTVSKFIASCASWTIRSIALPERIIQEDHRMTDSRRIELAAVLLRTGLGASAAQPRRRDALPGNALPQQTL